MRMLLRPLQGLMVLTVVILLQGCGGGKPDGYYTATTADGITIKMLRYRPDTTVPFHHTQPILLFPGLLENMNQYLAHTPSNETRNYSTLQIPANAPAWVANDKWIQADHMKYYSLAQWLYHAGYDVWLANYRGVGRGDFASQKGKLNTNLDVWMTMDTPAAIQKVIQVTGKKPVIGGHSTGGLVSYMYLQGVTMDASIVKAGKYLPHMTSSATLAAQRNAQVAGFLGLDPAGMPPLALEKALDNPLIWNILDLHWYVDFDYAVGQVVMPLLPPALTDGVVSLIFQTISNLANAFPEGTMNGFAQVFGALNFWDTSSMNKYTEDYVGREVLSSLYMGCIAEYADWGINFTFREDFRNGQENTSKIVPPDPNPGNDGYYYFDTNMSRMTVPALSFFSQNSALVDTQTMVNTIYHGKTYNPLDEWYEVPESGHIDLPLGESAPSFIFPTIIDWLAKLKNS